MAKKQSRRSVSLNATVYAKLAHEADKAGVSCGELIERGLRALGIQLPETHHMTPAARQTARRKRWVYKDGARKVGALRRPSLERQMLGNEIADRLGFQ